MTKDLKIKPAEIKQLYEQLGLSVLEFQRIYRGGIGCYLRHTWDYNSETETQDTEADEKTLGEETETKRPVCDTGYSRTIPLFVCGKKLHIKWEPERNDSSCQTLKPC